MTRWVALGTESGVQNEGVPKRAAGRGFRSHLCNQMPWLGLASTAFVIVIFTGRIDVVCSRRSYIVTYECLKWTEGR